MDHLFNSVVKVQRLHESAVDGDLTFTWVDMAAPLNYVKCRLDLNFLRPGKDQPMAVEAGKSPDRYGVAFCSMDVTIKAGDRLICIPNDIGEMSVSGTFEVKVIPDTAQSYWSAHHLEFGIYECSQALIGRFPGVSP